MNKRFLLTSFLITVAIFIGGAITLVKTTPAKASSLGCAPGTCQPTYGWQDVTPGTSYKCDSGWTLNGTTCTKTQTEDANKETVYSCDSGCFNCSRRPI
jgi:hypothetical protein